VASVREKRVFNGHLKIEKMKRQARNKYSMHVFIKYFYCFILFAALYLSFNSVSARTGEGVAKLKEGRRAKGEGEVENWEKCEQIFYG